MKAAVILGAGFSANSGIPVQGELPAKMISFRDNIPFEREVSRVIKSFMEDIYGCSGPDILPGMDDMLTCIDLSTNSGHHLGIKYSPLHLRTVRRLMVYRIFSILEQSFKYDPTVECLIKTLMEAFSEVTYIVLNWDTVLEKYLHRLYTGKAVDYCHGGSDWNTGKQAPIDGIKIMKLHGSDNWLYCDNCRTLFTDSSGSTSILQRAGFQKLDQELFENLSKYSEEMLIGLKCPSCKNDVSGHIATLSYRKSFRTNSFPDIWRKAENCMADADKWIFIGYSLPSADYEFKHLMKIAQMKYAHVRNRPVEIDVVLKESSEAPEIYNGFFGSSLSSLCNEGHEAYLEHLKGAFQ